MWHRRHHRTTTTNALLLLRLLLLVVAIVTAPVGRASADDSSVTTTEPRRLRGSSTAIVQLRLTGIIRQYEAVVSNTEYSVLGAGRTVTLMLPPDSNLDLCRDPSDTATSTSVPQSASQGSSTPIALLVSMSANCSIASQIQHVARLQQSMGIRYLIFHPASDDPSNTNPQALPNPTAILRSLPSTSNTDNMGLLFVSLTTGTTMRSVMRSVDQKNDEDGVTNSSPHVDTLGNNQWDLNLTITPSNNMEETRNDDSAGSSFNNGNGTSSHIVLYSIFLSMFLFVLATPCVMFLFKWWHDSGDGNSVEELMRARRMRQETTDTMKKNVLSKEQVMDLPILVYHDEDDDASSNGSTSATDEEETSSGDEENGRVEKDNVSMVEPDDERRVQKEQNSSTTSTVCSICILDFEEGERLRVLPRCRHAYHYDCIYPWLTERVGSCPDCKTNVLHDSSCCSSVEDDEEDATDEFVDSDEGEGARNDRTVALARRQETTPTPPV